MTDIEIQQLFKKLQDGQATSEEKQLLLYTVNTSFEALNKMLVDIIQNLPEDKK